MRYPPSEASRALPEYWADAWDLAPGEIGLIAPGARADILLIDEDPTARLSSLREWRILFADGRRYERDTLDEWLDEYRQHFHNWFQRDVMATVSSVAVGLFDHH